jgi:hypothetical protein
MAEISIHRESNTNDINFEDTLDFETIDNINVEKEKNIYDMFDNKKESHPSSKSFTRKEVPLDDINLLTNSSNSDSIGIGGNGVSENKSDAYSIHTGYDSNDHLNNLDNLDNNSVGGDFDNNFNMPDEEKPKTYAEIIEEKQDYLFKINRFKSSGMKSTQKLSLASDIVEIKYEYDRMKKERDIEKSVKFSRKALMACVSGVEFLNGKFDPFDVKLDGWSETVMENVDDYDEVFEELHDKYKGSGKMAPELRLMMMLGGSGFMFHLTNSLMKTAMPSVSDILKQNPDLAKNIQSAAFSSMNNKNDPVMNMIKGGMKMKQKRNNVREMTGPTGVDDILNRLHSNTENFDTISNDGELSGNENETEIVIPTKKKNRRKNNRRELDLGF